MGLPYLRRKEPDFPDFSSRDLVSESGLILGLRLSHPDRAGL